MRELKKDFNSRLENIVDPLFSSFSGLSYSSREVQFYFFYILKKIKKDVDNIILICNPSIESHVLSTFFILSKFKVYLLNNYSIENFIVKENSCLITLEEETINNLKKKHLSAQIIYALTIQDFIKWTHPSFDLNLSITEYKNNNKIGDSIFLSSGSTGEPKVIPLNYYQINECYKNVSVGFLNKCDFKNILSVHDTSFVIILPFIFSLVTNTNTVLCACDSKLVLNPILNLLINLDKYKNYLFISVPSVYRIASKLMNDKFKKFISEGNIISCGEPLDKKLAIQIFKSKPKSFFNLYGSTEVAPWIIILNVVSYIKNLSKENKIPSVLPAGNPLPGVSLSLTKESELLVSSKSVFDGYQNLDNNEFFIQKKDTKFFRTGDQFENKDGYYFCKGRINSSVKIAGVFVNPILLELEIKDKILINNLLIIPDIKNFQLLILIFSKEGDYSQDLFIKIKKILKSSTSLSIPLRFINENKSIKYLKSGKIDRNFYKKKFNLS